MDLKLEKYLEAADRAVAYVLSQQRIDGGYCGEDYPVDCYPKIAYSLAIFGRLREAHRLLDWIKENVLQEDGGIRYYQCPIS